MVAPAAEATGGFLSFRGYKVWYETSGHLRRGVPLVWLHGGPGIPGNSYTPLMRQLAAARPSVRYDQLGCGRSDRPNEPSLWQVRTFIDELTALRDALGLDQIHLLGHSWGGMLAIEYLLTRPTGVRSLILSSALCSTRFWVEEARRLRDQLPAYVVAAMRRFEEHHVKHGLAAPLTRGGTRPGITPRAVAVPARMMQWMMPVVTSVPVQRLASWASFVPVFRRMAYEVAGMAFMRRHVCRRPLSLVLCQDYLARNQQVYETMWGPSEFFVTGVLAEWNVESRLGELDVPTLILSGRHDEATPAHQQRLKDGIPGSVWATLEHSAHLTFFEEPDRYAEALTSFLERVETRLASAPNQGANASSTLPGIPP